MVLISGFSVFFLSSCDKDTNCYVKIDVIDEDTKMPVSGVFVKIDKDDSYINAEGYTNAQGRFETVFSAPAIFNVAATYETGYDDTVYKPEIFYCYRQGNNTIRLKEGDTVYSKVVLKSEVFHEYRTK